MRNRILVTEDNLYFGRRSMMFCQDQEMVEEMQICVPFLSPKIVSISDNASTFISLIKPVVIKSCQKLFE